MSKRILAMGISDSVQRMTPPAIRRHKPKRVGVWASWMGWFGVVFTVLFALRALA